MIGNTYIIDGVEYARSHDESGDCTKCDLYHREKADIGWVADCRLPFKCEESVWEELVHIYSLLKDEDLPPKKEEEEIKDEQE